MENSPSKSVYPVFIFFLLLLTAWFTYSVIGFTKAILTYSWPNTSGVVISSDIKRGNNSKGSPKYSPEITYHYQIGMEEYQSNRYSSTLARGTSQWAGQVVANYETNAAIKVYYNPKKHSDSVLDPGLQSDNWWMLILSSFFIVVVLLAFIKQIKDRRANLTDDEIIWQETERK